MRWPHQASERDGTRKNAKLTSRFVPRWGALPIQRVVLEAHLPILPLCLPCPSVSHSHMRTGSLGLLEAHLTTPDCGPVATLFPSVRLSPRPPSHRPPPPPPTITMPLPAMTHSSAFLLPASTTPPPNDAATTYALVVLNQRLPRFAPLLWARGDAPLLSLPPSLPASMPRFCHC